MKSEAIERAESQGKKVHEQLTKGDSSLHLDAYKGTAAEQRAYWHAALHTGGKIDTAQLHLPQGFSIKESEGQTAYGGKNHVVTDNKGKVIYDEKKVNEKSEDDTKIRRGEGPYSALRRAGLNHKEALDEITNLRKTIGDTDGKRVFKEGQRIDKDIDGSVIIGKASKNKFDSETFKDGKRVSSREGTLEPTGELRSPLTSKHTSYGPDGKVAAIKDTTYKNGTRAESKESTLDSNGHPTGSTERKFDERGRLTFESGTKLENGKPVSKVDSRFSRDGEVLRESTSYGPDGRTSSSVVNRYEYKDGNYVRRYETEFDASGKPVKHQTVSAEDDK